MQFSTYDGSGYVFDLVNLTTANLLESINKLRNPCNESAPCGTWLDRQTRALFISAVVFNANFNLYAVVNFELELSRAGIFTPNYNVQASRLDLYFGALDSASDTAFVVGEVFLYLGMAYYLLNEFRELVDIYNSTGSVRGYFTDFWNIIDWSLIILSFVALGMRISFVLSKEVLVLGMQALTTAPSSSPQVCASALCSATRCARSRRSRRSLKRSRPPSRCTTSHSLSTRSPPPLASSRSCATSTCRSTCSSCESQSREA